MADDANLSDCAIPSVQPVPFLAPQSHINHRRRRLVQAAGAAGLATIAGPAFIRKVYAAQKTLKILQWNHIVPAYGVWFDKTYVKEWGEKNDTEVVVDHVGIRAPPALPFPHSQIPHHTQKTAPVACSRRRRTGHVCRPVLHPQGLCSTKNPEIPSMESRRSGLWRLVRQDVCKRMGRKKRYRGRCRPRRHSRPCHPGCRRSF